MSAETPDLSQERESVHEDIGYRRVSHATGDSGIGNVPKPPKKPRSRRSTWSRGQRTVKPRSGTHDSTPKVKRWEEAKPEDAVITDEERAKSQPHIEAAKKALSSTAEIVPVGDDERTRPINEGDPVPEILPAVGYQLGSAIMRGAGADPELYDFDASAVKPPRNVHRD